MGAHYFVMLFVLWFQVKLIKSKLESLKVRRQNKFVVRSLSDALSAVTCNSLWEKSLFWHNSQSSHLCIDSSIIQHWFLPWILANNTILASGSKGIQPLFLALSLFLSVSLSLSLTHTHTHIHTHTHTHTHTQHTPDSKSNEVIYIIGPTNRNEKQTNKKRLVTAIFPLN